jgi:ankyrin repeat protein
LRYHASLYAAENGYIDIVKYLIENGAKVEVPGSATTTLICAARKGQTEIVTYLCNKKAIMDIMDKDGYTALMYASKGDYKYIVITLIEKGANVNILQPMQFKTALDYAKSDIVKRALKSAGGKTAEGLQYNY